MNETKTHNVETEVIYIGFFGKKTSHKHTFTFDDINTAKKFRRDWLDMTVPYCSEAHATLT